MTNRIVSLVPSLTEFLIHIGLNDEVVGRTRFCIHPASEISPIPIIGGTKNPNIEKIKALKPSLIIANKEENRREDIDQLRAFSEVVVTEISTIEEALFWMMRIGKLTHRYIEAEACVKQIRAELSPSFSSNPLTCLYLIWENPVMSIGSDTYIHSVLEQFNLTNACKEHLRYPTLDDTSLQSLDPNLILLSSEPFPFKNEHRLKYQQLFPDATVECVDGEWFSWYGSRMIFSFRALRKWRSTLKQRNSVSKPS